MIDQPSVEDTVFEHLDTSWSPEDRTEIGIAALLDLELFKVRAAMMALEQDGRIEAERRNDGLETWRTYNTPPPPSWAL